MLQKSSSTTPIIIVSLKRYVSIINAKVRDGKYVPIGFVTFSRKKY